MTYCWSFYFHATPIRLLCQIRRNPEPSTKARSRHDFRYLEDDQQYPPDNWTRLGVYSYPAPQCKITQCNYSVDLRSALWHFAFPSLSIESCHCGNFPLPYWYASPQSGRVRGVIVHDIDTFSL